MRIAVIGTGYVGLVTGTCLSETGNDVTCVDIDENKIRSLQAGEVPIYEPGLDVLLERNLRQKRLHFTTDMAEGIRGAEVIFLALPTPPGEDGSADLSYVLNVAAQLGEMLADYAVIVTKSTVPVGTIDKVRQQIRRHVRVDFDVVSNPEFLREGMAVEDFMRPERVIVGSNSSRATEVMETLYAPFVRQGNPIIVMDERSSELTKYAANAFLAMKISFMNEIANLCEIVGADVDQIRRGIGTDSRIGKRFLFPGIGYGGSCFPKDVQALASTARSVGYDFRILDAVTRVNDMQRTRLIGKMRENLDGVLKGKVIAVWGLSFKPHTDDIREAPAIYNIRELLAEEAVVRAHDPEAMNNARGVFGGSIQYFEDPYEATRGADALLIATEWPEFRSPDFDRLRGIMKTPLILDGRNLYATTQAQKFGFKYFSIGRPYDR